MGKSVLHTMPGRYAPIEKYLPFFELFVECGWDINSVERGRTALLQVYYILE